MPDKMVDCKVIRKGVRIDGKAKDIGDTIKLTPAGVENFVNKVEVIEKKKAASKKKAAADDKEADAK